MPAKPNSDTVSIVLVHGGFVDGSGWEGGLQIPEEGRSTRSASSKIPRTRWPMTSKRQDGSWPPRTAP